MSITLESLTNGSIRLGTPLQPICIISHMLIQVASKCEVMCLGLQLCAVHLQVGLDHIITAWLYVFSSEKVNT